MNHDRWRHHPHYRCRVDLAEPTEEAELVKYRVDGAS
jgi:hypothetical protein